MKRVVERFGRLDILVNNAGVLRHGPVHDRANNLAELERLFAVNVGGVATAVRAAAPLMNDGGRIISIGSIARRAPRLCPASPTIRPPRAPSPPIREAGRAIFGPRGITVNNVQPGPIDTDMNPRERRVRRRLQRRRTALGRYGKPEEVAAAVAFLASPAAAYITGTTPECRRRYQRLTLES